MKPISLLLADDDEDDRLFFQEVFSEIAPGSQILLKNDGKEVISYLSHPQVEYPDIIFLDLNMPIVNGQRCLEVIRQNRLLNDVFVVILTTTASPKEIDQVYQKGANLFLMKPNSFLELKQSIAIILNLDLKNSLQFRKREHFVFNLSAYNKPGTGMS